MMRSIGAKNECQSFDVTTESPLVADGAGYSIPYPLTIRVKPGGGGSMLVEYRLSASGDFIQWPYGTVSESKVYVLNGPVESLRFTSTTSNGVVDIAQ